MSDSPLGAQPPETPSSGAAAGTRSGARSRSASLADRLSGELAQLQRQMAIAVEEVAAEAAANARQAAASELLEVIAHIDGAKTQSDVLLALLAGGRRFASRTAFFLTRPGQIRGWAGQGFGRGSAALEGRVFSDPGGIWNELTQGAGTLRLGGAQCQEVTRFVDDVAGAEGLLIPFVLRGQLGGALYADRLEGESALGVAGLQLLTHAAAQAIETLAVRESASPALRLSDGDAGGVAGSPLWQPSVAGAQAAAVAGEAPPTSEERTADEDEPEELHAELTYPAPAVEEEPTLPPYGEPEPSAEEVLPLGGYAAAEPEEEEPLAPERAFAAPEPEEFVTEPESEAAEELGFAPAPEELSEEPEPELEDTSDIWALEDEADEEPTEVGLGAEEAMIEELPEVDYGEGEAIGQETVRLDIAALQGRAATSPPATEIEVPEIEPEPEPYSPPRYEPIPFEPPEEAAQPEGEVDEELTTRSDESFEDEGEEPTVMGDRADLRTAPESGYVPPPPEPRPDAGGSTLVQPPADLKGPGLAFVKPAQPETIEGEEALHEEARRLARLLVSEIKLYNEEIIEEGRRHGDIYERLKDDIDRSRQMYEERIDPRLVGREDYFQQELIQRLAGGNPALLGM